MTVTAYEALLRALRAAGVSSIAFGPQAAGAELPPPAAITFGEPPAPADAQASPDHDDADDADELELPDGVIDPRHAIARIHREDAKRRGRGA